MATEKESSGLGGGLAAAAGISALGNALSAGKIGGDQNVRSFDGATPDPRLQAILAPQNNTAKAIEGNHIFGKDAFTYLTQNDFSPQTTMQTPATINGGFGPAGFFAVNEHGGVEAMRDQGPTPMPGMEHFTQPFNTDFLGTGGTGGGGSTNNGGYGPGKPIQDNPHGGGGGGAGANRASNSSAESDLATGAIERARGRAGRPGVTSRLWRRPSPMRRRR